MTKSPSAHKLAWMFSKHTKFPQKTHLSVEWWLHFCCFPKITRIHLTQKTSQGNQIYHTKVTHPDFGEKYKNACLPCLYVLRMSRQFQVTANWRSCAETNGCLGSRKSYSLVQKTSIWAWAEMTVKIILFSNQYLCPRKLSTIWRISRPSLLDPTYAPLVLKHQRAIPHLLLHLLRHHTHT